MEPTLMEDVQPRNIQEDKGDVESTIAFLHDTLDHPMDKTVWDWEFNSFPETTVLTILKSGEATGGTQFILPVPLTINGAHMLSGKCENSYVAPEFKGKGWFDKLFSLALTDAHKKEMKVLWAFTPATKVYEKKLGFTVFLNSMKNFSGIWGKPSLDYFSQFSKNKLLITGKYLFYKLLKSGSLQRKFNAFKQSADYKTALPKFEVADKVKQPADLQNLYKELARIYPGLIHIDPTEKYMNWRIRQNPNLTYTAKFFYKEGSLVGYYIYAFKEDAVNLTVFTFLDKKIADVMFCHLFEAVKRSGKTDFHYFANVENPINQYIYQLCENMGGAIAPRADMPFVFRMYGETSQPEQLNDAANWYLNGLWTEGFNY